MTKLLQKAKIRDNVAANTVAIESGMYESSAASASEDFSQILGGSWIGVIVLKILTI